MVLELVRLNWVNDTSVTWNFTLLMGRKMSQTMSAARPRRKTIETTILIRRVKRQQHPHPHPEPRP